MYFLFTLDSTKFLTLNLSNVILFFFILSFFLLNQNSHSNSQINMRQVVFLMITLLPLIQECFPIPYGSVPNLTSDGLQPQEFPGEIGNQLSHKEGTETL